MLLEQGNTWVLLCGFMYDTVCVSHGFHRRNLTHDPKAHHFFKLSFPKKRSRIVEIGAARDTMFALTHSGICATFSRGTEISPVVLRPYLLDVLLSVVF
jgi:hypothetical protein